MRISHPPFALLVSYVALAACDAGTEASNSAPGQSGPLEAEPAASPALLTNAGFELGLAGWSDWGNTTLSSSNPHEGLHGLRIGNGAGGRVQRVAKLAPSTAYSLAAWGRLDEQGERLAIGVQWRGESRILSRESVTFTSTSWERKTIAFTTPSTLTDGEVWAWKDDGAASAYVDDFTLVANEVQVNTTPLSPGSAVQLIHVGDDGARPTQWSDADISRIDALPFDGIGLNTVTTWELMDPKPLVDVDEARVRSDLANVAKLKSVRANFLVIKVKKTADFFESDATWESKVYAKWRVVARVAKEAGLKGIVFDNEEYFVEQVGSLWDWQPSWPRSRQEYQRKAHQRGRELMQAIAAEWPDVHFLTMHGPYVSEPRTPSHVTLEQVATDSADLRGFFLAGNLEGAPDSARVVDGGEVYQYRTPQDFQASYDFRKTTFGSSSFASPVVPATLRAKWQNVSMSFGVSDLHWLEKHPMTSSIMGPTLENALRRADHYVWFWTEPSNGSLLLGTQATEWTDTVRAARSAAAKAR